MSKKLLLLAVITLFALPFNSYSQTNNVLLEYCTGTWCQWCPCGHDIISNIKQVYPNTVVLGYHGPDHPSYNDPWKQYSGGIISLMGFAGYPTGVIGRSSGIVSRTAWYNQVAVQSSFQPKVSIELNKNYNSSTGELTATANVTALENLTGDYHINFVIIESNMVYPQTGNSSCAGASNYVHNHVVKGMLNGDLGELLNSGSTWNQSTMHSKALNYTVPSGFVAENCHLVAFVYKKTGILSVNSEVAQAVKIEIDDPSSISNNNTIAESYSLSQNYPNPFNPTTNIVFSVPKDGHATFKVYDILGNLVSTYLDGFIQRGTYNVQFDGAGLSTGVYFYTLTTDGFSQTRKMLLNK
jgi:hypothetical protein